MKAKLGYVGFLFSSPVSVSVSFASPVVPSVLCFFFFSLRSCLFFLVPCSGSPLLSVFPRFFSVSPRLLRSLFSAVRGSFFVSLPPSFPRFFQSLRLAFSGPQFFFLVSRPLSPPFLSPGFFSAFSLVFLSSLFRWFGVCSWRRIIRLTNACSFPAPHLRFENKGKAGLLSFCSLPISLFLGPLSVFVHAPHWPLGSALFSPPPSLSPGFFRPFSPFRSLTVFPFFLPPALSHLLWLYSQRMPSNSTIETASKPLLQKPFLWKETKKATADF